MVFTTFLWNCCIVSAHTCLCLTTWLYFIALSHFLKNSLRDFLAINSFCKKNIPLIIFMRFDDDLSAYAKHGFVYHKPALMTGVRIPLSTPLLMLRVPRIGRFHILFHSNRLPATYWQRCKLKLAMVHPSFACINLVPFLSLFSSTCVFNEVPFPSVSSTQPEFYLTLLST